MKETIIIVVLICCLLLSTLVLYKFDIQRINDKVDVVQKQNVKTVEARKELMVKTLVVVNQQKKKIEEVENKITVHQKEVDDTQKDILAAIKELKETLKRIEDKLNEKGISK